MSKTVKILIIVAVVALLAYFGYKWYQAKKKAAIPGPKPPAFVATSGNPKAVAGESLVDIKSGGETVSNMSNGMAADSIQAPMPSGGGAKVVLIQQTPEAPPIVAHAETLQPVVSDMSNGIAADLLTRV